MWRLCVCVCVDWLMCPEKVLARCRCCGLIRAEIVAGIRWYLSYIPTFSPFCCLLYLSCVSINLLFLLFFLLFAASSLYLSCVSCNLLFLLFFLFLRPFYILSLLMFSFNFFFLIFAASLYLCLSCVSCKCEASSFSSPLFLVFVSLVSFFLFCCVCSSFCQFSFFLFSSFVPSSCLFTCSVSFDPFPSVFVF